MKKNNIPIFLFIVSGLLVAGFIARLIVDYVKYYQFGSSPFYLYVIVRAAEFLILATILLVVGIVLKKKSKENNGNNQTN